MKVIKRCKCCGTEHDILSLSESLIHDADSNLCFFQCPCGSTLTIKDSLLKHLKGEMDDE